MVKEAARSDVLDAVEHEHAHLRRLFDDIAETFRAIRDEQDDEPSKKEAVEMATDNLEMALDEMLEHFDEEEEVLFVAIENRYPDVRDEIGELVDAHERICERTRWLQQRMRAEKESVFKELDEILEVVDEVKELLTQHTQDEQQLFQQVLEVLPEGERKWLLKEMRHI